MIDDTLLSLVRCPIDGQALRVASADLTAALNRRIDERQLRDQCSKPDYREKLAEELKEVRESELWQAGAAVRNLRPEKATVEESMIN